VQRRHAAGGVEVVAVLAFVAIELVVQGEFGGPARGPAVCERQRELPPVDLFVSGGHVGIREILVVETAAGSVDEPPRTRQRGPAAEEVLELPVGPVSPAVQLVEIEEALVARVVGEPPSETPLLVRVQAHPQIPTHRRVAFLPRIRGDVAGVVVVERPHLGFHQQLRCANQSRHQDHRENQGCGGRPHSGTTMVSPA
jgi:hypothetical protein